MTAYGTTLTAGYNGGGQRAWKSTGAGTTYYLYDGDSPVCEMNSSGSVTAVNTFGGGLLSRSNGTASTFYTFDQQGGAAVRLTSTAGVVGAAQLMHTAIGLPAPTTAQILTAAMAHRRGTTPTPKRGFNSSVIVTMIRRPVDSSTGIPSAIRAESTFTGIVGIIRSIDTILLDYLSGGAVAGGVTALGIIAYGIASVGIGAVLIGGAAAIAPFILAGIVVGALVGTVVGMAQGDTWQTALYDGYNGSFAVGGAAASYESPTRFSCPDEPPAEPEPASVRQTGGETLTAVQYQARLDYADDTYEQIRQDDNWASKIAENTGMDEAKIQTIKDHVFMNEHQLRYGPGRFDSNPQMADAFGRLAAGTQTEQDIMLLEHEYFEANFESANNCDYDTAHAAAMKVYPWDAPDR